MMLSNTAREGLLGLLRDERELLDTFMRLTDEQAAFIAADDLGALRESINVRQGVIGQIDALRLRIDELTGSLPEEAVAADREISELCGSVQDVLGEIQRKNAANDAAAKKWIERLGEEIKKLSQSQKGIGGYGQGAQFGSSAYFDKKL